MCYKAVLEGKDTRKRNSMCKGPESREIDMFKDQWSKSNIAKICRGKKMSWERRGDADYAEPPKTR